MKTKNSSQAFREIQSSGFADRVLIAKLQQIQEHHVLLSSRAGSTDCIRGPVDKIRWSELHTLTDAIRSVLLRTNQVPAENIECDPHLWKQDSGWNPGVEIWLRFNSDFPVDLKKIHSVIESLLVGLRQSVSYTRDDFFSTDLPSVDRSAVGQIVSETLGMSGGRRLAQPIHIELDNRPTLKMEGKFGAKPSRANFNVQEVLISIQS